MVKVICSYEVKIELSYNYCNSFSKMSAAKDFELKR